MTVLILSSCYFLLWLDSQSQSSTTNTVISVEALSVNRFRYGFVHNNVKTKQYSSQLMSSPVPEPVVTLEELKPKTMRISQSMLFFAHYLSRHRYEQRLKKMLSKPCRKKLVSKIRSQSKLKEEIDNRLIKSLQDEVDTETHDNISFRDTLYKLNESRKDLIKLVGYDSALLIPCFGFATLAALMNSIIPHFYGLCITCLANAATTSYEEMLKPLVGLGISSVLCALFTGFRGSLFWLAGSRGNYNVRVKLHRNLLIQEAAFFDSTETGILLSRLNNDVNKIGMVISYHVNIVFRQTAQLIFGAAYLIKLSPSLAYYSFFGIFILAIISSIYGNFTRRLAERVQTMFADSTAVAETSFSMSETVRAFNGVNAETEKYEESQYHALELEEVQAWAYGTHKFVSDTFQTAIQGMILLACWSFGRGGKMPITQLATFMFYVNFVLESSGEIGDQWAKIQTAIGASSNVFDLIRRVPAIKDLHSNIKEASYVTKVHPNGASNNNDPIIDIKNMSVTYGTMEIPALNNINLNIYEGDRIAIVGRSGSGKSSLLRTLLRFYDPSSGSCKLEGINLTDMSRKEIASKISIVQQEPHLFPMSLMENVLYAVEKDSIDIETGKPCYSQQWRDKVAVALKVAGLPVTGKTKNDLDLDLDTRVGEGGRTLSGGQRQRVAIARALIREPVVLLLDEPTAALDSQSEKTVVEALRNAMEISKCMMMVTHRLGVVRSIGVNKVLVLEKGEIAEIGDPEDLLRRGGLYAELAREQGINSINETAYILR